MDESKSESEGRPLAAKTKEVKQDKENLLKELEENFTETEKVILSRRSTRWY